MRKEKALMLQYYFFTYYNSKLCFWRVLYCFKHPIGTM